MNDSFIRLRSTNRILFPFLSANGFKVECFFLNLYHFEVLHNRGDGYGSVKMGREIYLPKYLTL